VCGLTLQQFQERYDVPNRPVILTDIVPTWPAASTWDRASLAAAFAGQQVGGAGSGTGGQQWRLHAVVFASYLPARTLHSPPCPADRGVL
jgi:hypothetical protein